MRRCRVRPGSARGTRLTSRGRRGEAERSRREFGNGVVPEYAGEKLSSSESLAQGSTRSEGASTG